jgi:hypothetical protein
VARPLVEQSRSRSSLPAFALWSPPPRSVTPAAVGHVPYNLTRRPARRACSSCPCHRAPPGERVNLGGRRPDPHEVAVVALHHCPLGGLHSIPYVSVLSSALLWPHHHCPGWPA